MSDALIDLIDMCIREHALPSCDSYNALKQARNEITTLRQRVKDCEGAIERREQFIAEANSERDSAKDAEVTAWGEVDAIRKQLDSADAMVAVQSDILESIAVALKSAGNLSKEMYELIAKGIGADPDPFIMRKQAEAVEAIRPTAEMKAEMLGSFKFTEEMTCSACYFDEPDNDCEVCGGDVNYPQDFQIPWHSQKQIIGTAAAHVARRLRQQAEEAERPGGRQ